jgi:hypothetical protein
MHIVAAKRDTNLRLETAMTLRASRDDVRELWDRMEQVDELASPGPVRVVTVKLSSGHLASVVFHERKQLVEILTPLAPGVEAGLADLLVELDIAPDAVTWTHARIDRPTLFERTETVVPERGT